MTLDNTEKSTGQIDQNQLPISPLFFDNVCHYQKESEFSKYSSNLKLDGFKNFVILLLFISGSRLILENIVKYGFKANPIRWIVYVITDPLSRPTFHLFMILNVFILLALAIELAYYYYLVLKEGARQPDKSNGYKRFEVTDREEFIFSLLYLSLLFVMMIIPIIFNNFFDCNPYLCSFCCFLYSVAFLKLYSYHQVNSWWRTGTVYQGHLKPTEKCREKIQNYKEMLKDQKSLLTYPQNLNLFNILYFFYAPTLCYQLNYPRKKSIDFAFALRCLVEFVVLIELQCVLTQQWLIVPLSTDEFFLSKYTLSQFLLRWTKISLATISIWLIMFYSMFQSLLNLSAELLRFSDRNFYEDWWNSVTISQFWRNWNIPVHRWCVRHLYKPMLFRGYTKMQTTMVTFLISGVFHEYLVSVPLKKVSVHFLLGMTSQVFLEIVPMYIKSFRIANAFVWSSLIFGQSLLIILYYNDVMLNTQ